MSRDLSLLQPKFKDKIDLILFNCKKEGYILTPFCTERNPWEQARLWRKSRTTEQVKKKISFLNSKKAYFLARVLDEVGPQKIGGWKTNSLPGTSWHQFGMAIDCFLEIDKRACWDELHPGYFCYYYQARKQGLTIGYSWRKRDPVHTQFNNLLVLNSFCWMEINDYMVQKYNN